VPDDKFGEVVGAVVEPVPGATVDHEELKRHVRSKLAAYKAPKHVFTIDTIGRAPNGKVDYKRMKAYAADTAGAA
jgi:acyl-CoA synthetase (AMP-forming)/AMP-acid ligase II